MPKDGITSERGRRSIRPLLLGGVSALLAVGLVACGDEGADGPEDVDGTAATSTASTALPGASVVADQPEDSGTAVPHVTVDAEIIDAGSEDLEINAGDSIAWLNSDAEPRTISGEGFDATTVGPGERFTHQFTAEGTYEIRIEGGEPFTVTVLSGLQPEAQGTGVPHEPTSTPSN